MKTLRDRVSGYVQGDGNMHRRRYLGLALVLASDGEALTERQDED